MLLEETSKIVKYFIKYFTNIYINFLSFIFPTTHTGRVQESQICLCVIIDYSFVPYAKFEGICTENLRHIMMNVII